MNQIHSTIKGHSGNSQVARVESSKQSSRTPIVTFYSYKGGVGRSMALANIAILLAREFSLQVIAVDWDLEAPGLHRFFDIRDESIHDGVIHYLTRYKDSLLNSQKEINLESFSLLPSLIEVPNTEGKVRLLAAGALADRTQYANHVNGFDWNEFYAVWNGAQLIEYMRYQLKSLADIVLVDSRTGITDIGGICTIHLPDIVVIVFSFNDQNITGTELIARELSSDKPIFKELGRQPEILFLPSRKELSEVERLRSWEHQVADRLKAYFTSQRITTRYTEPLTYFRELFLPYVPYYAFGEELAVDSEKGIELIKPLRELAKMLITRPEVAQVQDLRKKADEAQAQGEYLEAIRIYNRALEISKEIEEWSSVGYITINLANTYRNLGQMERAIEYLQQALEFSREIEDRQVESSILVNLANTFRVTGRVERAIDYYEEALKIDVEIGDRSSQGNRLNNLGLAYIELNQAKRAVGFFEGALEIFRELRDKPGEVSVLGNLGTAYLELGDIERSIVSSGQAFTISNEIGDELAGGYHLINQGLAYEARGQFELAAENYLQSLEIFQRLGDRFGEGYAQDNLGNAYQKLGQLEGAIDHFEQALEVYQELAVWQEEGNILNNLGLAYRELGKLEAAIVYFERALGTFRDIGDRPNERIVLGNLGSIYADMGQASKAVEYLEQAREIDRESGAQPDEVPALARINTLWVKMEGIGRVYVQKLQEAGIPSPEKLLELGSTPKGRKEIAERTGISAKLILEWVNRVDLFRIKGVGEGYADLLDSTGVETVHELAQRDPEYLLQKMEEVNQAKKLVRKLPSYRQVGDWVAQAKSLPKIITY